MKEKQLAEGRGGREKYLEEGRRCADPQDSDFLCRGACVRCLRDDVALCIYHHPCQRCSCIDPAIVAIMAH